jgi:hypothetical protein
MRKALVCALALAVLPLAFAARAAAPAACPGNHGAPDRVFTGSFGSDLEGSYVLVPFEVFEGATRVRVKLCHDQPDAPTSSQIKHTLDLGIYDGLGPDGFYDFDEFRGWGGSSRPNVLITPEGDNTGSNGTTVGYIPGPVGPEPDDDPAIATEMWAAEIGVAAVADAAEGDSDESVAWRLEVFVGTNPEDLDDPWTPVAYDVTPAKASPGWYAGDFHVHAKHSNPNDATMREVFDYAFNDAGLDFITLSDYVSRRHFDEIGRFQADYPGKLIVRSAEVITYRGHINNHASATWVDYRTGPIYELKDGGLELVRDARPASAVFDAIHAAGGWTQINHPTTFPAAVPGFSHICRGCSWEYTDQETDWSKVDAFEIQTGPAGTPEPHGHELGPNPFAPLALEWWDRLYSAGHRITGVGVSDSHKAGQPQEVTQSPIGEATTVVYAEELSESGLHDAIKAGHAYVKFFSPHGPDLRFTATPPGGGPVAIMGDRLVAPSAVFEATVFGAQPSPEPRKLLILRDGKPHLATPVPANAYSFIFTASEPGHYRLQLMRGTAIEAVSNPITLATPPAPPKVPL